MRQAAAGQLASSAAAAAGGGRECCRLRSAARRAPGLGTERAPPWARAGGSCAEAEGDGREAPTHSRRRANASEYEGLFLSRLQLLVSLAPLALFVWLVRVEMRQRRRVQRAAGVHGGGAQPSAQGAGPGPNACAQQAAAAVTQQQAAGQAERQAAGQAERQTDSRKMRPGSPLADSGAAATAAPALARASPQATGRAGHGFQGRQAEGWQLL